MGEMTGLGLFCGFFVGTVGFSVFMYGKKQQRIPHALGGLALMAFPYFVTNAGATMALATLIILAIWAATRAGY